MKKMSFSPRLIILVALILSVSISPSLGRRVRYEGEDIIDLELEHELRDLCSQTDDSKVCWHIIKSHISQFTDTDPALVANVLLDLAITRGTEIHDELIRYHEDSKNEDLKKKYLSCSKNYNDAVRNLNIAKSNLDSKEYGKIPTQIEDTQQELEGCRGEFGEGSFDPGHIGNRINEFERYVNIVWVSIYGLLGWDTSEINK